MKIPLKLTRSRKYLRSSNPDTVMIKKTGKKNSSRKDSSGNKNGKTRMRQRREKSEQAARVLFIPGLGADQDMYLPVLRELARSGFPMKPTFLRLYSPEPGKETLEDFTRYLFEDQDLKGQTFDCVVGGSMGGMIAQQAYHDGLIKTDHMILMCTLYRGDQLTHLAKFGVILTSLTPRFTWKLIRGFVSIVYPLFRFNTPWAVIFARMIARFDIDLLFKAPKMIRNWRKGLDDRTTPVPDCSLFHFHGKFDPLISFPGVARMRKPEYIDPWGAHLIFVRRAREIAGMIDSRCHPQKEGI